MTDLRTAAQQALEALEFMADEWGFTQKANRPERWQAIEALRAALEQPERAQKMRDAGYTRRPTLREMSALAEPVQEPVAWRTFDGEGGYDYRTYEDNEDYAAEWAKRNPQHVGWVEPLYTAPPQRPAAPQEEPQCNPHPNAPHGFLRNASHTEGRYVCACEYWQPYEADKERSNP
jgi:hypothetical protein